MIKKLWNLYKKYEEIINYLIVGGLTTVVSLVVYYGSVLTFLNPDNAVQLQIANIISWIAAVAFAYVTNRIFVFKSKEENIVKECSAFVGSRVLTLLMDMFVMFLLVTVLHGNDKIAKIVSQIFVVIGNYLISKLFVFKKKKH
jgi:putative flippase GtrA